MKNTTKAKIKVKRLGKNPYIRADQGNPVRVGAFA